MNNKAVPEDSDGKVVVVGRVENIEVLLQFAQVARPVGLINIPHYTSTPGDSSAPGSVSDPVPGIADTLPDSPPDPNKFQFSFLYFFL